MRVEPPAPGAGDQVESELKFSAADAEVLRHLARTGHLGPVSLGPAATADEVDRYLDTAGRRLAQVRWACRLRTRGNRSIVSLKGPHLGPTDGEAAGFHRRVEVEGPATLHAQPGEWPASPARDRLAELTGGEALQELLVLRQQRVERALLDESRPPGERQRIGTLSLDTVTVVRTGRILGRLRVVEVELRPPAATDADLVRALRGALEAVPGLAPDPMSKLEHAEALLRQRSTADATRA